MQQKESMISRSFILLFAFSVAICTGMNMLNVIVPLYVTKTLGGMASTAGLMTTVYTVASCLSRPVNGVLTDRLGRRTMMALGSLLFCLGCFLGGLISAIAALAVCRILMGVGYSAANTANNTASTDVIPPSRLAEGIGYFGMSQSVASAIGPALAAVVMTGVGNQKSLLVVGGVSLLALGMTVAIRYESAPDYQRPVVQAQQKGGFFEKTAVLPSLFMGLFLFLLSCMMCFMPLYIVFRGQSEGVAGSFFLVSSVVIVGVRLLGSRWMKRFGPLWFLLPGLGMLAALCGLLPQVHSVAGMLACGALFGAADGVVWMVLGSEAVRLAPPERRGAANATFYFAFDAAIGLGAAFWGVMIDRVGYHVCFALIAAGALVLAAAGMLCFRKQRSASQF